MSATFQSTIRTLFWTSVAALALGCSADAASPDAGGAGDFDARVTQPRVDAMPFGIPDATPQPQFDAMPTCVDSSEPNETSAAAFSLSVDPISDADNAGGTFTGVALGSDLDWYTYQGSDDLGSSVDPTVEVVPADKVEVCMFFDCINPSSPRAFTCPVGSTASADGDLNGCCSNNGFTVAGIDCTGVSDDADVYIRVKPIAVDVCESYSISYHY